jgi:hypothetical protein
VNGWNGKLVPKNEICATEIDSLRGRRNGKIFIINIIVSYMIHMFDDNDVVHVVAPPGMASFNVLGEQDIDLWV